MIPFGESPRLWPFFVGFRRVFTPACALRAHVQGLLTPLLPPLWPALKYHLPIRVPDAAACGASSAEAAVDQDLGKNHRCAPA